MFTPDDKLYVYYFCGLCIVVAIIGLALLIKGAFPAQPDRGFDLSSDAEPRSASGTPLQRRQRRPMLILLALVLMGVGVAIPCIFGWVVANRVNPYTLKPFWWLQMNMESDDPITASMAFGEMASRYGNGNLAPAQIDALIARGLQLQAGGKLPRAWGDWIEKRHADGRLSDADWKRYQAGAKWSLAVLNRNALVRGGSGYSAPSITLQLQAGNVGTDLPRHGTFQIPDLQFTIDDRPIPQQQLDRGGGDPIQLGADPADLFTDLTDGPHTARVRGTAKVMTPDGGSIDLPLDCSFAMPLQRDQWPAEAFIHDPAARAAIASAMHVKLHAGRTPGTWPTLTVDLDVDSARLPYNVGFNVFVCQPYPRAVGSFTCRKGESPSVAQWKTVLEGVPEPTSVDVVFLPVPATGPAGEVEPIWDGGVRIKDVPIE